MDKVPYWGNIPGVTDNAPLASIGNFKQVIQVAAAATLTAAQSGSFVEVTGATYTITLPSPVVPNLRYTFNAVGTVAATLQTPAGTISRLLGTSSGSGSTYPLPGGTNTELVSDGTNWVVIRGSEVGNFRQFISVAAAKTLIADQSGSFVWTTGTAYNITLPAPTTTGLRFTVYGSGVSGTGPTVVTPSALIFRGGNGATSVPLKGGTSYEFVSDGTNWIALNGSGTALLGSSGYQIHDSGMILQWAKIAIAVGGGPSVFTFPIAFPNTCLAICLSDTGAGIFSVSGEPLTTSTMHAYSVNPDGTSPTIVTNAQYIAIGV